MKEKILYKLELNENKKFIGSLISIVAIVQSFIFHHSEGVTNIWLTVNMKLLSPSKG